jgi:hypothetical protein
MSDAEKAAKRFSVFDGICRKHGFTPTTLTKVPANRLSELIAAEKFPVFAPEAVLSGWAEEYATAKSNGN